MLCACIFSPIYLKTSKGLRTQFVPIERSFVYFLASETKGLAGFSPSALACFHKLWCMSCVFAVTLPKTNIELEDGPLEEDVNIYIYVYKYSCWKQAFSNASRSFSGVYGLLPSAP